MKKSPVSNEQRLFKLRSRSEPGGEEKKFFVLPDMEPRSSRP
jgi:hypothetical protein